MKPIEFYKKYIQPFLAILILVMLIASVTLLLKEQRLKKEISENCGFDGEDYRCYCEKSKVLEIEYLLNGTLLIPDVRLDR